MITNWKRLNTNSGDSEIPPLLIKYEFETFHYTVFVTDLTSMWTESLDRKQIVKRALIVDTSIDPSENYEQFKILLDNLEKALNEEGATKLALCKGKTPNQIALHTSTVLPASLAPLIWSFDLDPAPRDLLTTQLLVPCLVRQSFAIAQITSLIRQMKEKDNMISRLLDKMQADGVDLNKLFPGLAGLKSGTKSDVRDRGSQFIKGLGVFNEENWRRDLLKNTVFSSDMSDIFSQVFAPDFSDIPEVKYDRFDRVWWQRLKDEGFQEKEKTTSVSLVESKVAQASIKPENCNTKNDDIQRQFSSACVNFTDRDHQKKSSTAEMKNVQNSPPVMSDVTDDTTTDESDPEVLPRKPKTSLKESPSALGPRTSSSGKLTNDGLQIDVAHKSAISPSESEFAIKFKPSDLTTNSNLAEKDLSSIGVQKLKSRLGRIGGKHKLIDGEAEATAPNELILSPTSERDININESANAQQVSNSEISGLMRREQASVQPKSPSLPRETSQDRANRKREKLKRELENSTNVSAKKKRKF